MELIIILILGALKKRSYADYHQSIPIDIGMASIITGIVIAHKRWFLGVLNQFITRDTFSTPLTTRFILIINVPKKQIYKEKADPKLKKLSRSGQFYFYITNSHLIL